VNPGDAAAPDDIWLRPVTNETHLKPTAVHHGALKKWIAPPDDPNKPWKLEISGRLRSMVGSVSTDAAQMVEAQKAKLASANKKIPSAIRYCGILYSTVEDIRTISDFNGDVIYEPTAVDSAHANIVIMDKDASEILTVTDVLITKLILLKADQAAQSPVFSGCV
jgi:hypothetical protein